LIVMFMKAPFGRKPKKRAQATHGQAAADSYGLPWHRSVVFGAEGRAGAFNHPSGCLIVEAPRMGSEVVGQTSGDRRDAAY
jgi:hypothetical protein